MKRLLAVVFVLVAVGIGTVPAAWATPKDDLAAANVIVGRALTAARANDLVGALREYKSYETTWFDIEEGIRAESRDAYRAIEQQMSAVDAALTATRVDGAAAVTALVGLDTEQRKFLSGQSPAPSLGPPSTMKSGTASVATLVDLLDATRSSVASGDFATATTRFDTFADTWIDVEGEIKTRSASDYRATENDMARASNALKGRSPDAAGLLDGMKGRLVRYVDAGNYRPYDAMVIILREGLEALLVVVALLAFVKKSGNNDKQGWVWGGAGAGLAVSIALGVAIKVLFDQAFGGENRELLEGITGIVAAVMLLYVSYWLHSKSSLGAWKRYIGETTTKALARGSLIGLSLLSFLAVFREGAETVLFLLGMTGRIATGDLLLGLGIGAGILAVVGVLLTVVGLRLPVRPFFAVASVLTFYLCFKFLGTGLHALQVAGHLGARTATYLPENDTLGLFPTWQTTVPQALLLLAGVTSLLRRRLRRRSSPPSPATSPAPAPADAAAAREGVPS